MLFLNIKDAGIYANNTTMSNVDGMKKEFLNADLFGLVNEFHAESGCIDIDMSNVSIFKSIMSL